MDEHELKAAFAAFFIAEPTQDNSTAFAAALKLFPAEKDRGEACRIAFAWPQDPEVIVEMEKLRQDRPNAKIPTKEQVIEQMWMQVQNERVPAKDRAATARLVAEMLGYIKKDEGDDGKQRMPAHPQYKIVEE